MNNTTIKTIPGCLEYSGALGHTWALTYIQPDGTEELRGECSYGATAAQWVDQMKEREPNLTPRIWTRVKGPKRYKLVPYRAAVLDGEPEGGK